MTAMPLYLIEAPDNDDVLTLADAKAHLRVDGNEEDALIEGYVAAAIANLNGRDGWLGRALGEQAWELRLSSFSGNAIEVPLPPLIEVEGVSYYDTNNMLQTLPSSTYDVIGIGGFGKARIVLKAGRSWPGIASGDENIMVRFRAGYLTADATPQPNVPAPIVTAIKRMVGDLYENRQTIADGGDFSVLPGGVSPLLAPLRVW